MANTAQPILVVEQDRALRERLEAALRRQGFAVITVQSGERAITAMKHTRPGLVLAGVALADISGWELADRIRAFDSRLPIILLGRAPAAQPAAHGVQALLPADISPEMLALEVTRWAAAAPPSRPERWPGTVLVVDDEPQLRKILQESLTTHGFSSLSAASGEEAVEQVRLHNPTVVLLDIKMRGKLDGLETLKQIKALRPATTVFMVTGVEEDATMKDALALGATDYILKPVNLEYLETLLVTKTLLGETS
ncbi:MAG: response regulator [Candidatus Omnitrophica bacterium]|nr:response regulator [Candidatus Omnitrophota bacterium]